MSVRYVPPKKSSGVVGVVGFVGVIVVGVVALATALSALAAWPVMLALGVGHTQTDRCPALGFLATWACTFAIASIASLMRGHDSKKEKS